MIFSGWSIFRRWWLAVWEGLGHDGSVKKGNCENLANLHKDISSWFFGGMGLGEREFIGC